MTVGIELINDDYVTIVSDQYKVLTLRSWGTIVAGGVPPFPNPQGTVRLATVAYSGGPNPILAVHKPAMAGRDDLAVGLFGQSYDPGSNTWTFLVMVTSKGGLPGGADFSFSYYVFDDPPSSPSPTLAGLEFYGPGGDCFFSTSRQPMITRGSSSGLPSGKWAHTRSVALSGQNSTFEYSEGGQVVVRDIYSASATMAVCTPTAIVEAGVGWGDTGRWDYAPDGLAAGPLGGTLVIDVSRIH